MHTFWRLVLLAGASALAIALPAGAANAAEAGGAAAVDLHVTFDTPIAQGECSTTTSTLTGSLTGAFTLGGDLVRGGFALAGTGEPWAFGPCSYATSGDEIFAVALTGDDLDGRAIACTADLAVVRSSVMPAIGLVGGTCSIDGAGSYDLNGSLAGVTVPAPATGTPTTGYTFTGAFGQFSDG